MAETSGVGSQKSPVSDVVRSVPDDGPNAELGGTSASTLRAGSAPDGGTVSAGSVIRLMAAEILVIGQPNACDPAAYPRVAVAVVGDDVTRVTAASAGSGAETVARRPNISGD